MKNFQRKRIMLALLLAAVGSTMAGLYKCTEFDVFKTKNRKWQRQV